MVNAETAAGEFSSRQRVEAEITATRRRVSVGRPGYIPLVSLDQPLLRLVPGCSFVNGNGSLPIWRVAVSPAGTFKNSMLSNRENYRFQHVACSDALNSVDMP